MSKKGNLTAALSQFDKRPGIIENALPTEAKPAPPLNASTTEEHRRAKQPPSRQGKKALTGYFHPEVLKQLKVMAASGDTTVQALLAEALNDFFKKYGKPHIA